LSANHSPTANPSTIDGNHTLNAKLLRPSPPIRQFFHSFVVADGSRTVPRGAGPERERRVPLFTSQRSGAYHAPPHAWYEPEVYGRDPTKGFADATTTLASARAPVAEQLGGRSLGTKLSDAEYAVAKMSGDRPPYR
jgi:hypothetical protein